MAQLDELYVGDFEGFVSRRNEMAKRLRAEGDSEAADRVRALRKPSRPAWAINQVSAHQAKLRDELLGAGAALRQAQEQLVAGKAKGAELRVASDQEQTAVSAVLDAVAAFSGEAGARLSPAAVERARQTLHAVAREESVRRDFEHHRLTTEHASSGLDGFSLGAAPPPGKERQAAKRSREARRAEAEARKLGEREKEAEREVVGARLSAEQAQRDLERATKTLDRVANQAAAARERLDELREQSR